ncbi:MAG: hypothetical protein ABIF85_01035 [Nanoarchaeota archaeon]|nr:hypothetical protein [Nanoarchaeota archaeon]MBU4300374.1 hypothetical protein [Nanoarchaeota archaeon]MBU4451456.1 hypothetical protein [Nanoarchaeota archaeon]MCG2723776.1 hypothetical protein [archaeon]
MTYREITNVGNGGRIVYDEERKVPMIQFGELGGNLAPGEHLYSIPAIYILRKMNGAMDKYPGFDVVGADDDGIIISRKKCSLHISREEILTKVESSFGFVLR